MADEHECNMCGASFDTETELREHNQREHAEEID